MDATVTERPTVGGEGVSGEMELSEFHERVVKCAGDWDDLVPHQPWNILRRRKRKMGEVPRVVQR